jgi:hypothetical protein
MREVCTMNPNRRIMLLAVLATLAVPLVAGAQTDPLELEIAFDKHEYFVREPVRMIATLTNTSSRLVRIMEVSSLDNNMDDMYLEIVVPSGAVEKRRSRYRMDTTILNPNYSGEPLGSGATVTIRKLGVPEPDKITDE